MLLSSGLRDSINTNPDYQRPPVWTRSQKQLLIDTILRNYEIPKLIGVSRTSAVRDTM